MCKTPITILTENLHFTFFQDGHGDKDWWSKAGIEIENEISRISGIQIGWEHVSLIRILGNNKPTIACTLGEDPASIAPPTKIDP